MKGHLVKQQKQSGFAHLIIITVILAIGLIGTLGYVYYQNFIAKKADDTSKAPAVNTNGKNNDVTTKSEVVTYKTYTTDKYNISFKYPSSWSIEEKKYGDDSFYVRNVEMKNAEGVTIANFAVGMQLGGTCEVQSNYTIIDSEATKFQSDAYTSNGSRITKSAALSFTVIENEDGGYGVHYGLSDQYTELGATGKVCGNTFYYNIHPKLEGIFGLSFGDSVTGGLKQFSSINDAKKYIDSDEYKAIKKMILSLSY